MNYIKIHDEFISYFKTTSLRERLLIRDNKDPRLAEEKIYGENHHIIPRHFGGSDEAANLVKLLPEEHLFIHMLRYKAYNDRNDFIAVRRIINGFNKHIRYNKIKPFLNKKIRSTYSIFKISSVKFKKEIGWQTEDGKKRISISRKNKFPAVDLNGNNVGSVEKDHEKVISGEWVHHSKGKHSYINIETNEKIFCSVSDPRLLTSKWKPNNGNVSGKNNPKFSNITDEELEDFFYKISKICKEHFNKRNLPPIKFISEIWAKIDSRKFPNLCGGLRSGFRFNGNIDNLYNRSIKDLKMIHNKKQKYYSKNIDIEKLIERIKNVNN